MGRQVKETFEQWAKTDTGNEKENERRKIVYKVFREENPDVDITKLGSGSHERFKFKCQKCDNTWEARLDSITKNGSWCPNCCECGKIKETFEQWANTDTGSKEENERRKMVYKVFREENPDVKTDKIGSYDGSRFNFKCEKCGNEWEAKLFSVTKLGSGCPACNKNNTSLGEQFIYRLFKNNFTETKLHYTLKKADGISIRDGICMYEYDIFVPELKLLIEYSGENFHSKENIIALDKKKKYTADFHVLNLLTIIEKIKYDKTQLPCDIEVNCHHNYKCFIELADKIKEYIYNNYNIEIRTDLTSRECMDCYMAKFGGNREKIEQVVLFLMRNKNKELARKMFEISKTEVDRIYDTFAKFRMIPVYSRK